MQDAADTEVGQDVRRGNNTAHNAHADFPSPQTTSAGPSTSPLRDLSQLTCGCRNHRQLKQWLRDFLSHNPLDEKAQRNAGALRSLLAEIARWDAPVRLRLASLEVLRPAIVQHCGTLALAPLANFSHAQGGQNQRQRREQLTAVILYQHLAQAYASVSAQLLEQTHTLFFRRRLARALHRGCDSYRRLIQICNLAYQAPPKGSWSRLQQLVQTAREHGLEQRRVVDPLATGAADVPLLATRRLNRWEKLTQPYLQTALFASANPLQLTLDEQLQLWLCCGHWAGKAALLERADKSAQTLLCSLNLDQPPIPAVRLRRSAVDLKHFSSPLGWPVYLTGPLRLLQKRLRRPGALSVDMLERVQAIWAGAKSRGEQRTPAEMRCQVTIGISAIAYHLKRDGDEGPELAASFNARNSADLVMEVDSIDFNTGHALKDYEVARPLPTAPSVSHRSSEGARTAQKRYSPTPATLLNTSDNGAGLRLPADVQGRLHSGNLIALKVGEQWEVGLVRWQFGLPDQCRVGLELLGGHTSSVRVRRHTKDGRRTDAMAGLLNGVAGQPPELLLPTPLFQQGDTIDIVAAGQSHTVTLRQQSLNTGSIAIFAFS
ncbi:hypothetical protein Mag101_16305 [Microbulbifer agarilyticus]|uniref:GTPase n=1 Tax=Microbulbifer agarilyticus TaxID=260552 RepID=A0A1Q2M9Q9_9GAMM|nr:hypothetical protein [Microbulbifer agarilyticus]AQQ69017.1 hypothetical protein Mag101_16305 [Microbulbifer agarilyticus]